MSSKKLSGILPFIVTAVVTALVVFAVCLALELVMMFRCENMVTQKELDTNHLLEFATMEQLEKVIKREPTNYLAMIKLAHINEELNRNTEANVLYQKALKFSGRSYYTLYNYALFCAKQKLYALSSITAEEILSNNKKNIRYKAEIYEALGDTMLTDNQIEPAVRAYQVAYKYAKNVKDDKYAHTVAKKYSLAYIKLADLYIENDKIEDAKASLDNSIKITETPMAVYKLGLVNIDTNKVKAQKYLERVFNTEPYIVNPYIYNSLLSELVKQAENAGNAASLNYYSVKYERFKKTVKEIYLYKNDVIVSNAKISKVKDKYYLTFDFKNNTKEKIEQLYFVVDVFLNTKWYRAQKKAVHLTNTLAPYESVENFKIELPPNMEFVNVEKNNYIVLKFFAKKSVKAPNTLVKIDALNF